LNKNTQCSELFRPTSIDDKDRLSDLMDQGNATTHLSRLEVALSPQQTLLNQAELTPVVVRP
jgi:hypothetical protein